jgi:Trypsin-co-occurring domain 1
MANRVLVQSDSVEFYVELAEGGGAQAIASGGAYSFEDVEQTIRAVGSSVVRAWDVVKPTGASVEFNLQLVARSGKITGLLVGGETKASLKITLTWKAPPASKDAVAAIEGADAADRF